MYINFIPLTSVSSDMSGQSSVSASVESNALIDGLTDVSMSLPSLSSSATPTQVATPPLQMTTPPQQATPTQLVTPTELLRSIGSSIDSAQQSGSLNSLTRSTGGGTPDPTPPHGQSVLLTPDAFSSSASKYVQGFPSCNFASKSFISFYPWMKFLESCIS